MNTQNKSQESTVSRRKFLKQTSGALAGAALTSAIGTQSYAGENNTIKIALVGCGGRVMFDRQPPSGMVRFTAS